MSVECRGTITTRTPSAPLLINLTWLPFWLVSTKPADRSFRTTWRYVSGLSRANFHLNGRNDRNGGGGGRLKIEFQRLAEMIQRLLFAAAVAGDINLSALGDEPLAFLPHMGRVFLLHPNIISQLPKFIGSLAI
jgi:hypothetical protein